MFIKNDVYMVRCYTCSGMAELYANMCATIQSKYESMRLKHAQNRELEQRKACNIEFANLLELTRNIQKEDAYGTNINRVGNALATLRKDCAKYCAIEAAEKAHRSFTPEWESFSGIIYMGNDLDYAKRINPVIERTAQAGLVATGLK